MKFIKTTIFALFSATLLALSLQASAAESVSVVGVGGYDLVSYHTGKKPLPGNGNHAVVHEGVNYLFVSKKNADKFKKNVNKYLPAYGGYCAYGVAVGKKFVADPNVWEVVDGKLYLNLDTGIQKIWNKDQSGNIKKANGLWTEIKQVPAAKL